MTPRSKLAAHKDAWVRQLGEVLESDSRADNIIRLAELNGLFDPVKELYAIHELAKDDRVASHLVGIRVRNGMAR